MPAGEGAGLEAYGTDMEAVKKDPQCDVIVAPVPYYYKDYDGSSRTDAITETQFPSEVEMTDAGK